ncbi:MAG: PIG-L family deacetylase [Planctomycetota bacterium]
MNVRTVLSSLLCLCGAICSPQGLAAQQAEPASGLVAAHQALLDVRSDVVVLNVAAHPDDESSRTNTMLRRKYGMRIVQVYSTYGDGGQNAIGREIGPALAKIRVRETLRAAAMSGADVRFLGMKDFGFSKTREETLKFWGADKLKDRMRRVMDDVDPDIVITNHTLDRGHGHHRASIWAAIELLKERAAAGKYVPRLYARCGVDKAQLSFETGELDPARGMTYARLAWNAWVQHTSQGPWGKHDPLRVGRDYWRVVYPEGVVDADAADLSQWGAQRNKQWQGVKPNLPTDLLTRPLAEQRDVIRRAMVSIRALSQYDESQRVVMQKALEGLTRLLLAIEGVRAEAWLAREDVPRGGQGKGYVVVHGHERLTDLVVKCDGRQATVVRKPVRQTPFDDRPRARPALPKRPVPGADGGVSKEGAGEPVAKAPEKPAQDKGDAPQSTPLPGRYDVSFDCVAGGTDALPNGPEPSFVDVDVEFLLDGFSYSIQKRLYYTPVDAIELVFEREVVLVPNEQKSERLLSISVRNHTDDTIEGAVQLQMGPGIQATATPSRLSLSKEQREARILVRASIDAGEMTADAGLAVGFGDAVVRLPLRLIDAKVPAGANVALVRGPEDSTERTLADLGVPFVSLDRDALLTTNLDVFSVVLLDIRAYHHRPELAEVRERLQQYCRGGGRVVSMYHKPREWNERDGHPLLAPFALTVGNERVTEEDATVAILKPAHRLMTTPNKITSADFEGWVQERGLNFPKTWDSAWMPMLAMKDSGDEKQHEGPLLYTQYGKGDFIYCSLSLYRQLRRGNRGAVRLLANFIAR